MISGIIHVIKSGGRWVDAPAAYETLYNRFHRRADKGIWSAIFPALTDGRCRPVAFLLTGGLVRSPADSPYRCDRTGLGVVHRRVWGDRELRARFARILDLLAVDKGDSVTTAAATAAHMTDFDAGMVANLICDLSAGLL